MDNGSFKDLALDMVSFSILRNLTEKQEAYSHLDSEAFVTSDLRNLAEFTALFFKTFPSVDLQGLIIYILNRMRGN